MGSAAARAPTSPPAACCATRCRAPTAPLTAGWATGCWTASAPASAPPCWSIGGPTSHRWVGGPGQARQQSVLHVVSRGSLYGTHAATASSRCLCAGSSGQKQRQRRAHSHALQQRAVVPASSSAHANSLLMPTICAWRPMHRMYLAGRGGADGRASTGVWAEQHLLR